MTKKILGILAMLSVASMMLLSSCTAAGVECGLIGKWEYSSGGHKVTMEITSDDKIKFKSDGHSTEGTIKSVDGHKIKYSADNMDIEMEYRNLTCDSVEIGGNDNWTKCTKVY